MTFLLRRYDVEVAGFATQTYAAASRGKALYIAYLDYTHAYNRSFGEFMAIARARKSKSPDEEGFGKSITVSGAPAYQVGTRGQYVAFVRPNETQILFSHPLDVKEAP